MKKLFIFAAGVVAGAVAGAYLVKDKVLADAKQEINEVREYYKEKMKKQEVDKEEPVVEKPKVEEKEYKEIARQYVNYNNVAVETPKNYMMPEDEPYIISSEEFGDKEEEGWDTMTITYFADKVLVDDTDEVIEEAEVVVGLDSLRVFEEFPDATCVYVRNEIWRTDFEILRDDWKWADLQDPPTDKKPHQL